MPAPRDDARFNRARDELIRLLRQAHEAAGREWSTDDDGAVERLLEDLIAAARDS